MKYLSKRWSYITQCGAHAKKHHGAAVLAIILAAYSFFSNLAPFVEYPAVTLPKIPLSWAAYILLLSVLFMVIEGGYRLRESDRHEVQSRLDGAPKLICRDVSSHPAEIRVRYDNVTSSPLVSGWKLVGTPEFYHLHIVNEPTGEIDRQAAKRVGARVQIFHEDGTPAASERFHRWEHSPGPAEAGKKADQLLPIDISPSGVPAKLDIAMKYEEDDAFHTPNNDTANKGPMDWREEKFKFPRGKYIAKIYLRGDNVVRDLECRIVNRGVGEKLEITPLSC